MSVVIADRFLEQAGLSEQEALVEFACHLFDTGKLALWPAAQLAGLTRVQMESELRARGTPIYRPTLDDLEADIKNNRLLRENQ